MVLESIVNYLQSLPKGFTFSTRTTGPTVISNLSKRTSVSVISIVNIDALLLPPFGRMPFRLRIFIF
jgi:hypothetical protein